MARVKRILAYPALRDSFYVFVYYYVGIAVLQRLEGWHKGKTIYFLSMTLTTVGFGDVTPTTVAGKWFVTAYAPAGIVLVFSIIARYMSAVQGWLQRGTEAALALLGVRVIDTRSLPIESYSPRDVSRVVHYRYRYLLAAAPVALLVAGFVVIIKIHDDLTGSDAVYLAVITSTTVGYGDFSFGRPRGRLAEAGSLGTTLLSAYTILVVVVLANSIVELFAIWRRQRLRDEGVCDFGPSPRELEELLLDKYAALSAEDERAGAEPALSEADYVVATLIRANLVDDQILFAIRRNFHWDTLPKHQAKLSTMITAEDVHALPKKRPSITQHSLRASHTGQGRVAPAEGRGRASPPDSPVDEPYDAWRARYWEPRLASRRAERRERSRELHSQSSVYSWAASGSFDDDGEAAV